MKCLGYLSDPSHCASSFPNFQVFFLQEKVVEKLKMCENVQARSELALRETELQQKVEEVRF